MVSLGLHQSVAGEVNGRIGKFLGMVKDGNEGDGDHALSRQIMPKSIQEFYSPCSRGTQATSKKQARGECPCPLTDPVRQL